LNAKNQEEKNNGDISGTYSDHFENTEQMKRDERDREARAER